MNKVKLKDIAQVVAGQSPKSIYYNTEMKGLPFLQGNRTFGNLFPYIDTWTTKVTKKAKKGDVLISVRAPVGDLNLCETDLCIGRGLAAISSEKYPNRFIYYSLKYNINSLISSSSGTTFSSINKNDLESLDLIIPEENQISNVTNLLSALDDKIELNNTINTELEAMAKTLYDYWFVQFEFPNSEGKPYKSSGGAMEYNSILKREIPKGWEVKKVGELLKKIDSNRKLSAKEYYLTGKLPIVDQSTDFIAGFTDNEDYKISINKNDPAIIFGDHTRILKLINFDFVRGADGTQVLFTNSNKMPQYLFYHSLLKIDLSNYGYARHFKFLKDRFVVVPDEDLANRFNMVVKSFFDKALSNQKQNQELAQLRDWLLPMLMNGQVKVVDHQYNTVNNVVSMAAESNTNYSKGSQALV